MNTAPFGREVKCSFPACGGRFRPFSPGFVAFRLRIAVMVQSPVFFACLGQKVQVIVSVYIYRNEVKFVG